MRKENWKAWCRAAGIRALRTMAQSAIAALGTGAAFYTVDWKAVGAVALMAGVLSILMSLSGLPEVQL